MHHLGANHIFPDAIQGMKYQAVITGWPGSCRAAAPARATIILSNEQDAADQPRGDPQGNQGSQLLLPAFHIQLKRGWSYNPCHQEEKAETRKKASLKSTPFTAAASPLARVASRVKPSREVINTIFN